MILASPGKTWEMPSESCEWLNKRFFNLKSGNYWTSVNGQPKYQHCKMNDGGIPPGELRYLDSSCSHFDFRLYLLE